MGGLDWIGGSGGLPPALVVPCAGIMCSIVLSLLAPQKWQLDFGLFVSCHYLPQLLMHVVIFSPLEFLCILFLKEMFVQMQALQ